MMKAIFLTSPELIAQYWGQAAELIDPVVHRAARGEFDTADLHALVVAGRAYSAVVLEDKVTLAVVFEFKHYPRKIVINVIALGGQNLTEVAVIFWPKFVSWAKEAGAEGIEASTSPAMSRVLKGLGLVHTYDLVRLDFGENT